MTELHVADEDPPILSYRVEDDPLALTETAEKRSLERAGAQVDLGSVGVTNDDSGTGDRVVGLDDSLVHWSGLDDLAGTDARSTDPCSTGVGSVLDPDSLDIGEPATVVAFVREAHAFSVTWFLAADFAAIRHDKTPGGV